MTPDTAVSYRFDAHTTQMLLCSRCFRAGIRRRIRQVLSRHHRLKPLCRACRSPAHPTGSKPVSIERRD